MDNQNVPATAKNTMELLKSTPVSEIMKLPFVKERFITMFNICNRSDMGELVYTRNLMHIHGILSKMSGKNEIDKISVLNCILKIAEKGVSADPMDKEIYLIPRKGSLYIQPQEQFYVKGLINTKQIAYAEKAELVYQGDDFKVSKGKVLEHIRLFKSDKIIAGYKIFVLNGGAERHFIYYPEHWEVWRASAPEPNGANWRGQKLADDGKTWIPSGQPKIPFLETKIGTHAANSNVWTKTAPPPGQGVAANVIILEDEIDYSEEMPSNTVKEHEEAEYVNEETGEVTTQNTAATSEAKKEELPPHILKDKPSFLKNKAERPTAVTEDKPF